MASFRVDITDETAHALCKIITAAVDKSMAPGASLDEKFRSANKLTRFVSRVRGKLARRVLKGVEAANAS